MKIYIIRHGTTVWNEKGITQGRSQSRLSVNGKKLVENSAEILKNMNFEVIYTSPLFRAVQTTNIINKYHKVGIIKDDRLMELDQGLFTGRKYSSYTEYESEQHRIRSKAYGMESIKELYDRVRSFFEEITKKGVYNTILIVTHSAVASCLERIINGVEYSEEEYKKHLFSNAEIKQFEI